MNRLSSKGTIIIAGTSHPQLASLIADHLGVACAECEIYHKPNRETVVDIGENIRGRDVYIIQTGEFRVLFL